MKTPYLVVESDAEPTVLFGAGARYYAEASGSVTLRPIDNNAVTISVPGRTNSLSLQGGDSLSVSVAAGYLVVELV